MDEYSNAIVHAFQKFRAPFSGKIVHIFPEQSAVREYETFSVK